MISTIAMALAITLLLFVAWSQQKRIDYLEYAHDRNATVLAILMAEVINNEEEESELWQKLDD